MTDGKRIKTLMICLVLVISGLFLIPAIGADDGARTSARYADPDHNTNDFAPNITINSNPTPSIWNDGVDIIQLIVEVSDEDKNETGGALNATGGSTASVTADMTPLGGSATQAMYDDGTNGDFLAGDDIWTYNVTTTATAGDYEIYFNATDNGTALNGGPMSNNTMDTGLNVTLTVDQINRAPVGTTPPTIKFDEDMYNNTLDLDMYFTDPDADPLSYTKDMMGDTNITVVLTGSMVNVTAEPNWFGQATFKITGNDTISNEPPGAIGLADEVTISVLVASINDMPMLNDSADWDVNADVNYAGSDVFEGDEGDMWWINVSATDMDMYNPTPDTLAFDVENSAALPTIFSIDATTGVFEFTPTNDEVGMHTVNVSVTDGIDTDYKNVTFDIGNVNDDPMLTKVWVGTSSVNIVNHNASLTGADAAMEDEEFVFTVEGMDDDVGDILTFTIETGPTSMTKTAYGDMKANFTYTPTNDDALMGYLMVHISVKDGGLSADDYVMVNISITNVNDDPIIDKVDTETPDDSKYKEMTKKKAGDYDNFTIEVSDIDGDTITVSSDVSSVTAEDAGDGVWNITFHPLVAGNVTANITISDGTTTDYYVFFWEVESAVITEPNNAPTITITTTTVEGVEIGDKIIIEGTISDPDAGDTVEVMVEVVKPGGTTSGLFSSIDVDTGTRDWIVYNGDGTWTYTYDTSYDTLAALVTDLNGDWTFVFIAEDDHGAKSESNQMSVTVKDKEDITEDVEGLLALGFMLCLLIILIPLIIIIVVIVLLLKKKKAKAAPPPEMPPPMPPMACTACGAEIPPGAEACPACGAAAMAPEPPVACVACGAEIPPGAEACPACGAAAPAPAEAPPVETMCECGATIPAGSPTCAACGRPAPAPMPPEGAVPMACAACGAEVPPGSVACPACGAEVPPPPEMPPAEGEAPLEGEEAPVEEGGEAPAEDAQMVACPTCGAQIAVGSTPCASCGTDLNWG